MKALVMIRLAMRIASFVAIIFEVQKFLYVCKWTFHRNATHIVPYITALISGKYTCNLAYKQFLEVPLSECKVCLSRTAPDHQWRPAATSDQPSQTDLCTFCKRKIGIDSLAGIYIIVCMQFEWDDTKNTENQRKHGLSFELAQNAFADPNRVFKDDVRHSDNEPRYFCIGDTGGGKIATVRFTLRGDTIRIFGAGYWRKQGSFYYEQNFG
jgi:uncharacterized DUF497 family protein